MMRFLLVLAVIALSTVVVAMPAMADDWGNNNWKNHNDCDWWGCDHDKDCDWRGCGHNDNDCDWWGCDHNDFDRSQPFFFPIFNNDDCEWEFEEGWFWTFWGWQWGAWVLDC